MTDTARVNLTIAKGATFRHTFVWSTEAGPVALTGFTARMRARLNHGDPDPPLLDLTTANGGIVLEPGGVLGRIDLFMSDAATAALPWRQAVYDLELVSAGGEVTRLVEGTVVATPEVTT